VREEKRIDPPDATDVRKTPRRGAMAEVEQEAPAGGLDQKAGRAFAAEAGDDGEGGH